MGQQPTPMGPTGQSGGPFPSPGIPASWYVMQVSEHLFLNSTWEKTHLDDTEVMTDNFTLYHEPNPAPSKPVSIY